MSQNLQNSAKSQKNQLDNRVDFEKCCKTHIFLQKFVLIQPRTSPPKICKKLQKIAKFRNFADPNPLRAPRNRPRYSRKRAFASLSQSHRVPTGRARRPPLLLTPRPTEARKLLVSLLGMRQTLQGSFSAVSK